MIQTIHIPAAKAPAQRNCDQLGVCQGRTIPCLTCTQTDMPEWQADDYAPCTPIEAIGVWAVIVFCAVISLALMAGGVVFVASHLLP